MMRSIRLSCVVMLVGMVCGSAVAGENWPHWRGPLFNGSSGAKDLPEVIKADGALWSTAMPGHSNGTPIVYDDVVYTTAQTPGAKLLAIALSRKDGKILWQKEVGEVSAKNERNDFATPSPVADGKRAIFLFGSGDLAAYDTSGNELWKRNLQKEYGAWNMQWLYGSSPTLYNGKLYVQVLHRNVPAKEWGDPKPGTALAESYLLAVDPATGKDLWKVTRPNEARVESQESYGSPIPWEKPSRNEILLTGGDCVTGHDPETGKELWRAGGWNPEKLKDRRIVASPVAVDGVVVVCPPKGVPTIAWKEGGEGDVTVKNLAWKGKGLTSDVCVPLVYQGNLYVLDGDKKALSCVDPKTGEKKWSGTIESRPVFRTSPTGADGKIYVMNEAGDLYVLSATEFKVLSKASLGGEGSRGSIAAVDGMVVVRTGDKVWAFGK